VAEQNKEL
jgi:hypothetical protein